MTEYEADALLRERFEWGFRHPIASLFMLAVAIATAVIGYHIHGSVFWSICDFLFWPWAWIKWMICQQVNVSLIKESFAFFFR